MAFDVLRRLAERRIGRPGAAVDERWPFREVESGEFLAQVGPQVAPAGRWEVVEARALVAERALDHHERRDPGGAAMRPAEVRLMRSLHPLATSSSATSTANGAPTVNGTMATSRSASVKRLSVVW